MGLKIIQKISDKKNKNIILNFLIFQMDIKKMIIFRFINQIFYNF